jgi:hypothetical protein
VGAPQIGSGSPAVVVVSDTSLKSTPVPMKSPWLTVARDDDAAARQAA